MRVPWKLILLLMPLLIWLLFFMILNIGQQRVEQYFPDQTSASWVADEKKLTVNINKSVDPQNIELQQNEITVLTSDGKELLKNIIEIDRDMGAAGFVAFIQLDDDADLEIIVSERGGKAEKNYYLDHNNGQVQRQPLSNADSHINEVIQDWYKYHAPNPFSAGLFLLLTLLYYVLFFPVAWLVKKFTAARHNSH